MAINPLRLRGAKKKLPAASSLLIGCCSDPWGRTHINAGWYPDCPVLSRPIITLSILSRPACLGRKAAKRRPKGRCILPVQGWTSPGSTAPVSGPKVSPSRTCWVWSQTYRPGSSTARPRVPLCRRRALGPNSREQEAWAASLSRGGRCLSASGFCAAWLRSSRPEDRVSCQDTCRCCRRGPTATTCRTWRLRGTRTPVWIRLKDCVHSETV